MLWSNMIGVEKVAKRHWICRKQAALFFARLSLSTDKLYSDERRLQAAVNAGLVKTKKQGSRTLYNMWDCMQNCNIL